MKRLVLLATLVAPIGCTPTMNFLAPNNETVRSARPAETRAPFRAPVVASQVAADNAKDKAQALSDELDRDLQSAIESRDKDK